MPVGDGAQGDRRVAPRRGDIDVALWPAGRIDAWKLGPVRCGVNGLDRQEVKRASYCYGSIRNDRYENSSRRAARRPGTSGGVARPPPG